MVSSKTGRDYIQNELKFISPFKSMKDESYKGLNASLFEYMSKGKTYGWEYPRLPDGTTELIGAAMIKYLGREATKDELYEAIDRIIIDRTKDVSK
jgi:raffinose/stachyose/melibiose transport system substrate-binding protein